jgi:excisionase family DNA binding protein
MIELPPGESLPIHVVARALSCHRNHLVNLIEAGHLEAYDLRGPHSSRSTIRITRQTLIEWLASRKIPKV